MSRSAKLDPLFRSLQSLKGAGPHLEALLRRFFGAGEVQDLVVLDLLMHMPVGAIDRSRQVPVAEAYPGQTVTVEVHIDRHQPPPKGRPNLPHRVYAHDDSAEIEIVYFRAQGGWVEKSLPVGEKRILSGEIGFFNGQKQITHPDHVVEPEKRDTLPLVEPVYPLTAGLTLKALNKVMLQAAELVPALDEWILPDRVSELKSPPFQAAMRSQHSPKSPRDCDLEGPARIRLAYDEYLAGQLALQLVRSRLLVRTGVSRAVSGELVEKLEAALPFALTSGQRNAIAEIRADLQGPNRMSRLLQGDVGAGKTVVALMAAAMVAEDGAQSAMMAPTDLLAAQHYKTVAPLCEAAGLRAAILTGSTPAAERRSVLAALASGEISLIVGTHALFQGTVEFANLGLTIVDEQHRFGVYQRLALSAKGRDTELLVMTATPIPRTLVLTHFGDMEVSVLREKPAGRQPIDTAALPDSEFDRVVARLKTRIDEGAQAYWVCPLVEESDAVDMMSAQERYDTLKPVFGDRVALVHGRMKATEKQQTMQRFSSGDIRILVATTVIEVGVDVPNASIMIVEHAERFGLAQLHQLRGRVGRGANKSACLLLYRTPLSETAKARLDTIVKTEDGFEIAEKDLELRGQGDVLGTRQSGMPGYHIAVPDVHSWLVELAHKDARRILDDNPGLQGTHGNAVRNLLYIFRKDQAIPLIRAG